uniref:uncharacterized protein LOC108950930 n=1 Tax=Ciona intestinalis TaxID=7719 RepID=UPI000EF4AA7A|nr:uncharacterized protein LOC108950930 [Ciona intestinalis]XP_026696058.1 uncharacterized protein LOC108950930 [Ciona intestinalis]|eukprot:XP_026696057.1 uncharacterized protein LOC108950930 [Ciona intestinalis]
MRMRWEKWRNKLVHLGDITVKRCFHPHGFGKSRVAPLKPVTVPRMELTAAVVSARMSRYLRDHIRFNDYDEYFWTDSKVVLGYIGNDARKFQTFVANRLQTIKENTNEHEWRYVKTEENPSDCASRGMKPEDLTMNSIWLRGPNFLWESSTNLQRCFVNHDPEVMKGIQLEMKKGVVLKTIAGFGVSDLGNRLVHVSTWHKAKRAVANCVAWKLKRRQDQNLKVGRSQSLDAERRIIRSIQHLYFLAEIQTLTFASERGNQRETSKRTKQKLKRQSSLYRLDPFLDNEEMLRVDYATLA